MFSVISKKRIDIPNVNVIVFEDFSAAIEQVSTPYFLVLSGDEVIDEKSVSKINEMLTDYMPDLACFSNNDETKCLNYFRRHNQQVILPLIYKFGNIFDTASVIKSGKYKNYKQLAFYQFFRQQKILFIPNEFKMISSGFEADDILQMIYCLDESIVDGTFVNERDFVNNACRYMIEKQKNSSDDRILFNLVALLDRRI